jgi:diacylglycerol kinase
MEKKHLSKQKFGIKRLGYSFSHSFDGFRFACRNEQNMRIHLVSAAIVVICGFVFKISPAEWLVCLLLFGLVMSSELFNTALEATIDAVIPDQQPLAKTAKDVSSAAVLVLSITAAIIGLVIFLPKIIAFISVAT